MKSLKDLRTTLVEHDLGGDRVPQMHTPGYTPPNILILKRKTVRAFSGTERVALYYSEKLGRYFSVPFTVGREADQDHIVGVSEDTTTTLEEEHKIGDKVKFRSAASDVLKHGKVFKVEGDHVIINHRPEAGGKYGYHYRVHRDHIVKEDVVSEISIPTATRAFHARDKRGIEALQKKDYKTATFHFKKSVKTLDHRAKKYAKSDAGLVVEEVIQEGAISHLRKVKEFHTNTPLNHKDGTKTRVDPTTAHALLSVHDSMHTDNQKKFSDALEHSQAKFHKIVDFAWKQVKS